MSQTRTSPRPLGAVGLIAAALAAFAALAAGAPSGRGADAPASGHVTWIVDGHDLAALRAKNSGLARRFFDNPHAFVIGDTSGRQDLVPRGYNAVPTLRYKSLVDLQADLRRHRIARTVRAVLYDPERWPPTPAVEQRHPVETMRRFVEIARRAGYRPFVAPGRDLTLVAGAGCRKHPRETLDHAYVRCRLADGMQGSAGFVLQAAPSETDPAALRQLLRETAALARRGSSQATLIATLSTAPPSTKKPIWPVTLVRAATLELQSVHGIMLNFTPSTTWLAASFLRDLERKGNVGGLRLTG